MVLAFICGFWTALVTVAIVILVIYLERSRKYTEIKGYLDLIPDLSNEQRLKVRTIRQTFLPKVDAIRQNLYDRRIALARALFSGPTDRNKVFSAAKKILECQSELEQQVIEHIMEEKELLSPVQKRNFYHIILQQFAHGGLGVHDVRQRRKLF
jgi:hypothetical protein